MSCPPPPPLPHNMCQHLKLKVTSCGSCSSADTSGAWKKKQQLKLKLSNQISLCLRSTFHTFRKKKQQQRNDLRTAWRLTLSAAIIMSPERNKKRVLWNKDKCFLKTQNSYSPVLNNLLLSAFLSNVTFSGGESHAVSVFGFIQCWENSNDWISATSVFFKGDPLWD